MAEVIRMPKMSDTMEEGVIVSWLKKVGDTVESGDVLAEVETDKATMELESYSDGTILYIGIEEKQTVPVDGVLAIIGEKDEKIDSLLKEVQGKSSDVVISNATGNENEPEKTGNDPMQAIDISNIKATVITMPRMSDTMEAGVIASWQKKVGESVQSGDILAEIETDKATMELESYEDGILLYISTEAGNTISVDGVLAVIGEKGADFATLLKAEEQNKKQARTSEKAESQPEKNSPIKLEETLSASSESSDENERLKASPLAKKIAKELGYNLKDMKGTGEGGRIIKRDVENYTPQAAITTDLSASQEKEVSALELPTIVAEESYEEVPVSQMRKTIGRRLSESKFGSPHFYVTIEINMDKAIETRKSLNEISPVKISFNDMIIKAVAAALRKNPNVNSSWMGDKIRYNKHIHIGVAMAQPDGLLVPVVRFADNKSLSHIAAEVKDYAQKARAKKLQPQDWKGNTFTISNLGMFGVEEFTAIINPPDACILAVGGIKQTAIVKDGQLVPGNVMKVTLSSDHRVVDGVVAAAFLQALQQLMEDPVRMLI